MFCQKFNLLSSFFLNSIIWHLNTKFTKIELKYFEIIKFDTRWRFLLKSHYTTSLFSLELKKSSIAKNLRQLHVFPRTLSTTHTHILPLSSLNNVALPSPELSQIVSSFLPSVTSPFISIIFSLQRSV